jgi:hypothetical protein
MSVATNYKTIKVTDDVHQQLLKLVSDLNEKGWHHLGVDRRDSPTISSVIAEGIGRLKTKKSK